MSLLEQQLKYLVKFLSSIDIDYVILGGLAVSVYGDPRFTADIDVNIALTHKDLAHFLRSARKSGFRPIPKNIKTFVRKTGVIPMCFGKGNISGRCDFIVAESVIEELALKRGRKRKFGSVWAKFVSPEDLIIHKLTAARPRDIEDVQGILLRQRGKLDIRYVTHWIKLIDRANRRSDLHRLFRTLL